MTMHQKNSFLDPDFLKRLELLRITSKKTILGPLKGYQKSAKRGSSVEFKDYRNYVHGDDLRYIDWNVFGRLDRLFLKIFREEVDLTLHIMIDSSKSMSIGEPSKLDYALKIAAALSYLALSNLDRVALVPFSSNLENFLPPLRGKNQIFKVFEFLSEIEPKSHTNLNKCLRNYAMRLKNSGMIVVISDFFDPNGYEEGLKYLRYRGNEVMSVQVLDETEVNPQIIGDLKLIDIETSEYRDISISRGTLKAYKKRLEAFCEGL
ncbi:MAG: DUF58 domain-containing protein, partial [Methanosarcinales archaeon]